MESYQQASAGWLRGVSGPAIGRLCSLFQAERLFWINAYPRRLHTVGQEVGCSSFTEAGVSGMEFYFVLLREPKSKLLPCLEEAKLVIMQGLDANFTK